MTNDELQTKLMNALNKIGEAREILEEVESESEFNLGMEIESLDENMTPSVANNILSRIQELNERE